MIRGTLNPVSPVQKLTPVCSPRVPTYSRRPVTATLRTTASLPCCAAPCSPSSALNSRRVERRHRIRAIPEAPAERAVNPGARLEPRRRHDDGVDERPLDAVEHRRLVTLVDDADRDEQHPGAEVQRRAHEEIEIRLLELELAALLEAFDDRVLELELADEPQPIGKAVREEQHETVEIQNRRGAIRRLIQVELHVAGQRPGGGCRRRVALEGAWAACRRGRSLRSWP